MIKATISDKCIGCGVCSEICINEAIVPAGRYQYKVDDTKCKGCGLCLKKICDSSAITSIEV